MNNLSFLFCLLLVGNSWCLGQGNTYYFPYPAEFEINTNPESDLILSVTRNSFRQGTWTNIPGYINQPMWIHVRLKCAKLPNVADPHNIEAQYQFKIPMFNHIQILGDKYTSELKQNKFGVAQAYFEVADLKTDAVDSLCKLFIENGIATVSRDFKTDKKTITDLYSYEYLASKNKRGFWLKLNPLNFVSKTSK